MAKQMFDIEMQDNLQIIRRKLGDMEKRAPNVAANALNRTLTALKKYIPAELKETYTYKRELKTPRAQRASYKKLSATLFYGRHNEGIHRFSFNRGTYGFPRNMKGKKLSVKILQEGGYTDIYAAFSGEHFGKKIVFHRNSIQEQEDAKATARKKGTYKEKYKYEMRLLTGPSEHSMVNRVWAQHSTQRDVGKELSKQLDLQINNQYLKKWGLK